MTERKLASIRQIDSIDPIEDADMIEVATIGGWKVVVKKGEFNSGDLAVYIEIDSWVPYQLAPFLSKGQPPREYNGVLGERLRTVKLRKQVSQGLLLPYAVCGKICAEDEDVTELLGIQKWEMPMSAQLSGIARGNFPSFVHKTDQERIQNMKKELTQFGHHVWEVTEKLDGSSMTVYMYDNVFGVCSRNLDLTETESNSFWRMARELDLENKMRNLNLNSIAIQGELIGPGIQGNIYKLDKPQFRVFDMFDIRTQEKISSVQRELLTARLYLTHSPILGRVMLREGVTIEEILQEAEGKSYLNDKVEREGLVYKSVSHPDVSFKAISNMFLLKEA